MLVGALDSCELAKDAPEPAKCPRVTGVTEGCPEQTSIIRPIDKFQEKVMI